MLPREACCSTRTLCQARLGVDTSLRNNDHSTEKWCIDTQAKNPYITCKWHMRKQLRTAKTWTRTKIPADAAEGPGTVAAHTADTEHMDPVAAAAAAAADLATVHIQLSQHRSNFAVLHNPSRCNSDSSGSVARQTIMKRYSSNFATAAGLSASKSSCSELRE